MKQILYIILVLVCCYSCYQNDISLFHECKTLRSEKSILLNERDTYKGFGFKTSNFATKNQRAVTEGEYFLLCRYIDLVFWENSIYDYLLYKLGYYAPFIAIDESLTNGREAYYDTGEGVIYFHPDKITTRNLKHEFMHWLQHKQCGYSMNVNGNNVRNIEYEAFVAMDIIQCFENKRMLDPQKDKIYGAPQGKQDEYINFIYQLVYQPLSLMEIEIQYKFNEWIEDWGLYEDESSSSDFIPRLVYYLRSIFQDIQNN